ncbi:glycoside hydrolase [Gymnopus androsaceus JB14]|uniref:Alpha-amylase n=1 Tax=Gymnopus androsaceus JB14 TaxID=1447944 RepID=A0A6A4H7W0_9AGAR|nr:glycoside hydrolase [Gymnopus androsaceus JB14]
MSLPLLLALPLVFSLFPQVMMRKSPSIGSRNVIVQMFEWSWDSIAAECTSFLGPAGYGYVQASPAQEHITGSEWWTDYQPVSYILTSKRGNRTQFKNMIDTCHEAGVKVIADTIFNHMTGIASRTGVAGSTYTHYDYPGVYEPQNFHYCGLEPNDLILNWDNEEEVWTCQLDGLADLATDTEYVRGRLAEYANDLISLGVDGMRLDSAKSISPTDLANITSRFTSAPYLTQEVVYGDGQPVTPEMYRVIGDVQEEFRSIRFRYTTAVMDAFSVGGSISNLQKLDDQGWINSSQANVFVANHDTERLWKYGLSGFLFSLKILIFLHSMISVTILSSYSFSNFDDGAPNNGTGDCTGTGGSGDGWICQHRWVAVSGMTRFRNDVGKTEMNNWVSPQPNQIAFGRGNRGFVAINNDDYPWSTTFMTSLRNGTYCDAITGVVSSRSCTGSSFTVSSGRFKANIPPRSAIAIHSSARVSTKLTRS